MCILGRECVPPQEQQVLSLTLGTVHSETQLKEDGSPLGI